MTTEPMNDDERLEMTVLSGAVALALVVGLGFAAHKVGLLEDVLGGLGGKGPLKVGAAVVDVIKAEAKANNGNPGRVLLSGTVGSEDDVKSLTAGLKKTFAQSEHKSSLRADARAKEKNREVVRISFAADAPNEAWPRPRFGDIKRLEMLWKDEKLTVRGAVFSATASQAMKTAFDKIPPASRGAYQIREVVRSNVPAQQLQDDVIGALNGRSVTFDEAGALTAADANADAILSALAPLLKDLTGLEVVISAGAAERGLAMKQAETIRDGLAARGADLSGLRPVPAPKNNLLSLIVREKE